MGINFPGSTSSRSSEGSEIRLLKVPKFPFEVTRVALELKMQTLRYFRPMTGVLRVSKDAAKQVGTRERPGGLLEFRTNKGTTGVGCSSSWPRASRGHDPGQPPAVGAGRIEGRKTNGPRDDPTTAMTDHILPEGVPRGLRRPNLRVAPPRAPEAATKTKRRSLEGRNIRAAAGGSAARFRGLFPELIKSGPLVRHPSSRRSFPCRQLALGSSPNALLPRSARSPGASNGPFTHSR